jgi:hypothetical protein
MVFTEAKLGGGADDEVDPGAGVGHHGPGRGSHHPSQDVPQGPYPGMWFLGTIPSSVGDPDPEPDPSQTSGSGSFPFT